MKRVIKASLQNENDDDFDMYGMNNKKYRVYTVDTYDTLYTGDDSRKAILFWIRNAKKHYSCIAIDARNKDNAIELIKFAHDNIDYLTQMFEKYKIPYKTDYMINAINETYDNNCKWFSSKYPDQVYPFALG